MVEDPTALGVILSVSVFAFCFACATWCGRPGRRRDTDYETVVEAALVVVGVPASEGPLGECCVCLEDRRRQMVAEGWFGGCGHEALVCVECAARLLRCPLCRRTAGGSARGGDEGAEGGTLLLRLAAITARRGSQAHGEAGEAEGVEHGGVVGVPDAGAEAGVVEGGEAVGVAEGGVGAVAHEQADDADGALPDGVDERGAAHVVEGVDVGLELEKGGDGGPGAGGVLGGDVGLEGAALDPVEAGLAADGEVEGGLAGLVALVRAQAVPGDEVADDRGRHDGGADGGRAEVILDAGVGAAELGKKELNKLI